MVEWLKIEGPLDAFPPPSYEKLFAGVPLKARSVGEGRARRAGALPRIEEPRREQSWYDDPLVPASAQAEGGRRAPDPRASCRARFAAR